MSFLEDLERMPKDLKYEVTFRALAEMVKAGTFMMVRFSDLLDRYEKLLDKAEAQAWSEAIRGQLKQREKRGHNGRAKFTAIRK